MPYIPHTPEDLKAMLKVIGIPEAKALFDEIPDSLLLPKGALQLPAPLNEMEGARLMRERAALDKPLVCFIGAGAYDHHIPAPVWEIAGRGEFLTSYTPYQAEASQGTLQVLFEFQTMIAGLTGLDASNASLYDGASALGEAVLMAVRANEPAGVRRVLLPSTVHPTYRRVVRTVTRQQGIELVELPFCSDTGQIPLEALERWSQEHFSALVIPQPNFFGVLEEVDQLTDWTHKHRGLVIGVVNPVSLALLRPPGEWGSRGADIACGEGQPLGIPLSSGGPYFGFLACRQPLIRQMPGRIVGRTLERAELGGEHPKAGFTLTLQAREQHIRRAKATSNICSNQGLMTIAAALHMTLMGPKGLREAALACHANTLSLVQRLKRIPGVRQRFASPFFHEAALELPLPVETVLTALTERGVAGGFALGADYPGLDSCLLVCATERRTEGEMEAYAAHLDEILTARGGCAPC
ncbi:MAG: aminomethyl-transferring glycine dehydrogenase subunit GcvPA [Magnetococcales bacterium]|nr:aminomethyl-transferring glycine dehydrogenase subunit GcvPA [Magnetococcales bacterium]